MLSLENSMELEIWDVLSIIYNSDVINLFCIKRFMFCDNAGI